MKQGQRRSPWLLILRLHSCVISYAPVFDTTSPGGRATDLDRSWLHCVMGVSPPRGSLPAALLACGWDWAEVSLSLAESLRNSPPQAVLWTDGSACRRDRQGIAPSPGLVQVGCGDPRFRLPARTLHGFSNTPSSLKDKVPASENGGRHSS